MRKVLFIAGALTALVASVAIAQTPPPPRDGAPPPPSEMMRGDMMHGDMNRGDMNRGEMGHGGWMRGRPPMPPKAAFFRFRDGDKSLTVKCADDESTKACTDAVAAMMAAINPAH